MKVGEVNVLTVTNLIGQSEPITKYNGYERHEEVNGSLELSFSSFFNEHNPGHDLIVEESIVEKDGYEFRVKQLSENRFSKQVKALSTYFDLNGVIREEIFGGTNTLNGFLNYVLNATGWMFENIDVTDSRLIPNFGEGNVVTLINQLTATFECEYQILPNKVIRFAKQIGPDYDAQYRYGHNIKALSKKVDTTKLRTRIKGVGGDGLTVIYTSPNAATFGISDAETVNDERFTIAESLTERIKKDLVDYPEISIELDTIELQQKEIGERVWLIYEPLGIEFQTRVLAKTLRIPETKSSVVIGNAVPRSLSDILASTKVDIDQNKKETRSRIEQTNEMITLEVERVDESIATLTLQADEIILNVSGIDGRLGTAESQISVQAGQIELKVSQTDYNGNTIASLINQTATTILLQADNIDLTGIVRVADSIELGLSSNGATKAIKFNNLSAWIYSNGENLNLDASYLFMRGRTTFYGEVDFQNFAVSNLTVPYATNAGTLGGLYPNQFSQSGHDHGNTYIRPSSGQSISLGAGASTLNVYVDGSLQGTISYN